MGNILSAWQTVPKDDGVIIELHEYFLNASSAVHEIASFWRYED